MGLFQKYYEEFLKYDKEVLVKTIENLCESRAYLDFCNSIEQVKEIRQEMREWIEGADESRPDWDLDLDDIDR